MPELKTLKLKICGLRDNIAEVTAMLPDYAGFIGYGKSSRFIGDDFTLERLKCIPASVKKVGVFVNQPVTEVLEVVEKLNLDYVQLHGNESVAYCEQIKTADIGVIKVFSGNGKLNKNELDDYMDNIDFYLFDTRLQHYGGSGIRFEWRKLEDLDLKKPVFLSGGLDLTNIQELEQMNGLNIHAIDVNSKFELSPGLKDVELIKKLTATMQRA